MGLDDTTPLQVAVAVLKEQYAQIRDTLATLGGDIKRLAEAVDRQSSTSTKVALLEQEVVAIKRDLHELVETKKAADKDTRAKITKILFDTLHIVIVAAISVYLMANFHVALPIG